MFATITKKRWDQIITFLGIAGFILAIVLSDTVFPSASIDLSTPRDTIKQEAIAYIKKVEPDIENYIASQRFSSAWASIYLQKTIGIPETRDRIVQDNLPIYYWYHRYFKPKQQEEFSIDLSPQGEVYSYYHTIPDTFPGADLPESEALKIASKYLTQARHWELKNWELVDSSSTLQQSDRRDHTFNWKAKEFNIGDAELRLSVTIQGEEIGAYDYYIKIPEEFSREFDKQYNLAAFFARISYLTGENIALAAAFLFFIVAIAKEKLNWKNGLWVSVISGSIYLLDRLNTLPSYKAFYWTTENYTLFWLERIYNIGFGLLISVIPLYFLWMGGHQIVKKVWPNEDKFLPRSLNRWHVFSRSYWRGLMMGGLTLGALNIFYLIAVQWFSAWSPMGVSYSNFLATPLPFLAPLETGMIPAISEELVSRYVGIALVQWLTRRRWLALLIPGVLWAVAHLTYTRDPFYLRGIELTLSAVFIYGFLFLKFDLLTTIVGHCTYNALLGTGLLLTSKNTYLVVNGIIVILILLAPLALSLWQQSRYAYRSERYGFAQVTEGEYDKFRQTMPNFSQKSWSELNKNKSIEALGIWIGDNLRGVIVAEIRKDIAEVKVIYVDPDYRRCYFGTKLVNEFYQQLATKEITKLTMTVTENNDILQLFWRNLNWQSSSKTFLAPPLKV